MIRRDHYVIERLEAVQSFKLAPLDIHPMSESGPKERAPAFG